MARSLGASAPQEASSAATASREGLQLPPSGPAPLLVEVTVPLDVGPGSQLQVAVPDGRVIEVICPPNARPGQTIRVQVTPPNLLSESPPPTAPSAASVAGGIGYYGDPDNMELAVNPQRQGSHQLDEDEQLRLALAASLSTPDYEVRPLSPTAPVPDAAPIAPIDGVDEAMLATLLELGIPAPNARAALLSGAISSCRLMFTTGLLPHATASQD